jgi:PKD repeat protein
MQISPFSHAHAGRRLMAAAGLVVALVYLLAAQANAAEGPQYGSIGQYGEVTRFGGFDSNAYDNGAYDKPLTPGKFLNPVGFAVDPEDTEAGGTAVYVLDRVSDWPEKTTLTQGTEWRLQKLSDTGEVLGTTEFYLPKTVVSEAQFNVPVSVIGLAVNHADGQIYTVLEETTGTEAAATQYADEVIGWSTTPQNGKLVAAGSKADLVSTPVAGYGPAGLISDSSQLNVTPVYTPEGLAVDDVDGQNYIALDGDGSERSGSGKIEGPAIVEQISIASGEETGTWSAASLSGITNASSADATGIAAGISTDADGSLNVLLATKGSQLDAIKLPADLTSTPTVVASKEVDTSSEWAHALQVPNAKDAYPGASAPVIDLSNNLYAADYWLNGGGFGYWNESENEGIRLITPSEQGLLSTLELPPTTIFDTLGDATQSSACYLGDEGISGVETGMTLAAGGHGAIWILTSGEDSSIASTAETQTNRQVIELAPDASSPCAGPSGTFTLTDTTATKPVAQPASTITPLTIPVGHTVEFNASTIDYPTAAAETQAPIYAYEWAPTGAGYTITNDTTEELLPITTASYQYTAPGVYNVELKLLGDFGEYDEDGTIIAQTASPPTAAFTAPTTAQTGQSVSFDASQSQAANGAQISDYHWSFGDGTTDDTQSATDTHTYAKAGTYTVTLTVRDDDTQSSTPVSQMITVSSPPSGGGSGTTTTPTTTTPATTTPATTTPTATIDRSATNVNPKAGQSSNNVVLTVTCPATKVSCAGTVQVKTAGAVAASSAKSTKTKKKVLTLGQATFSLNGGQRETLTIKISSTGAALLKKDRTLAIDVVVAAHDSYGDPLTKTLALALHEQAPKKAGDKKKK